MIVGLSFTFLCLLSVRQATSLACTDLLEPLDHLDPPQMLGRWALVAGTFNDSALLEFFKRRDSSSIYFSNVSATSNISYSVGVRMDGKCYHAAYRVTLDGGTLNFDAQDRFNLTLTFMQTSCPDCVVVRFDKDSKEVERLWLFSRRREVEMEQLEEFRAQAECMKMLPPAVLDPTKDLCQEQ